MIKLFCLFSYPRKNNTIGGPRENIKVIAYFNLSKKEVLICGIKIVNLACL